MENIGYRRIVRLCVCVCVCVPNTKNGNNVLGQGLRDILGVKSEGVAGGRMKLHIVQLHELYW